VLTGLNLSLYRAASTHIFDQATQTTGRGNSKKWRLFRILHDIFYETIFAILPVKAY